MGGDFAPTATVAAAAAISRETTIRVLLVGHPDRLKEQLDLHPHDASRVSIVPAMEVVGMSEKPKEALLAKRDASITVAARTVAEGGADALVSAGSTGALVLAAAKNIPLLEGVKRAALAAVYPTRMRSFNNDRFALILDVGATVRCTSEQLLQFAYMGHAYASRISKVPAPAIGLLNMGEEETKGDEILTAAYRMMKEDPRLNFIGNIEGIDIPRGVADVVVTSGFVGNVVLKMLEGVSETVVRLARYAHKERLAWRLGLLALSSAIDQLKSITDWQQYGGAPLLGFTHPFIKAHGRSNARAVTNAIKVAHKALAGNLCGNIARTMAELDQRSHRGRLTSSPDPGATGHTGGHTGGPGDAGGASEVDA